MSEQNNTITIKSGKRTTTIRTPQSWDDLDDRSALLFYNTLFTGTGDEFTHGAFTSVKLISMTQHILGFPPDFMKNWEADCVKADPEHGETIFLEELKALITATLSHKEAGKPPRGLFEIVEDEETGGTAYAVLYNRTKNPWPSLVAPKKPGSQKARTAPPRGGAGGAKWYYCAKDGLANITLYELAYTFSMYEAYLRTQEEQYANKLIAALYRPSRPETREERESAWHGDRRQPLRRYEDKVDERAKMAASLPVLTRRFIVFWFAGCREAIAKQYPRVFKKGDGASDGRGGEWGKLLLSLAESGTFGPLSETSDQHFSNALTYMSMKDEQREAAEREADAMKRKRR